MELQSLVGRLNQHCRKTLEAAIALALTRTHYNVEIEHWLQKLIETPDSDIFLIFRRFEIDPSRVTAGLTVSLDRVLAGSGRSPALAPNIVKLLREAWGFSSLHCQQSTIRSGHVLFALLSDTMLAPQIREAVPELGRIEIQTLRQGFADMVSGSTEDVAGAVGAASSTPETGRPVLEQFATDLTARAHDGSIDPVVGRDDEIRQVIDILCRRRQNNPILTGEAGVGKTAIVEGLALRIASGEVPAGLEGVRLLSLDLALLQAGAGMKGEFEERLKGVIEAVKTSPKPIIMFIDEAHMLIGAGGAAGQGDAANLLKPALARGEMRTIAATTWAEYRKYIERDPALTRRFQAVKVEEPSDEAAMAMLRGLVPALERHHGVHVLSEGMEEAVRLSRRYIPGRQLPDKAVSLLDTACARVAACRLTPPALTDCQRNISTNEAKLAALYREAQIGKEHDERIRDLEADLASTRLEMVDLQCQWEAERDLVTRIRRLHEEIEATDGDTAALETLRGKAKELDLELTQLQRDRPQIRVNVDGASVAEVVSNWTGVPVGRVVSDEIETVLGLKDRLAQRIIGQPHAVEAIARRIHTSRAKLTDPQKPLGVFLLVGTSGVGKTETALALADQLYGGEQSLTVINMSEYKEEHKISTLVGAPPGYVGYGEGGVLTDAIRRRPYSVLLLDEVEKAHQGVQEIFYRLLDKGVLRDGEGRDVDFRNTVIIMTSNAGSEILRRLIDEGGEDLSPDILAEKIRPELLKSFKPAFLGRCTVVPYYPLASDAMRVILDMQLRRIGERLYLHHGLRLLWDQALSEQVARFCTEHDSGARNIEHILAQELLPELSALVIATAHGNAAPDAIRISLDSDGHFLLQPQEKRDELYKHQKFETREADVASAP